MDHIPLLWTAVGLLLAIGFYLLRRVWQLTDLFKVLAESHAEAGRRWQQTRLHLQERIHHAVAEVEEMHRRQNSLVRQVDHHCASLLDRAHTVRRSGAQVAAENSIPQRDSVLRAPPGQSLLAELKKTRRDPAQSNYTQMREEVLADLVDPDSLFDTGRTDIPVQTLFAVANAHYPEPSRAEPDPEPRAFGGGSSDGGGASGGWDSSSSDSGSSSSDSGSSSCGGD